MHYNKAQHIEYHDLTNTKGLLALNLGPTKLTSHYNNLIHIIDVADIRNSLNQMYHNIFETEFNETKSFYNLKNLKQQYTNLDHKIESIEIQHYRNKRGLIDGLGTVFKKITGNMDNDDAIEINNQIETLKNNQLLITDRMTGQHQLNAQMIERFDNITKFINCEQAKLKLLASAMQSFPTVEQQLFQSQFYFSLQSQLQYLDNHVSDIISSISLAKLGIISKHILTKKELTIVHDSLSKQVNILNDEHLYELLELRAYYNDSNILFVVMIPQFTNETFQTIKLRPIPENHQIIKPKSSYILYNPNKYQFLEKSCNRIEQSLICPPTKLQTPTSNTCEIKILENKPANCTLHRTMENDFIEEIEDNHIIVITSIKLNITNNCGKNITNFVGRLHVILSQCQANINGITYGNLHTSVDNIKLEQIIYNTVNITNIATDINLENLQMKHLENTQELNLLKYQQIAHISISFIIIIVVLIFILIFFIYKCYFKKKTQLQDEPVVAYKTQPSAPVIQFPWEIKQPS